MLQREQDWLAFKTARKMCDKKLKKRALSQDKSIDGSIEGEIEVARGKAKDSGRSLWEGKKDEKGRVRIWKNKVTGEEIKTRKGEKPMEGKGAILADDVSWLHYQSKC